MAREAPLPSLLVAFLLGEAVTRGGRPPNLLRNAGHFMPENNEPCHNDKRPCPAKSAVDPRPKSLQKGRSRGVGGRSAKPLENVNF